MKKFAPLALMLVAPLGATPQSPNLLPDVIVVDPGGGPGVDFTSLASAIAVARPGGRIELRPGSYLPVTVTTPIVLMGEPGVFVNGITVDSQSSPRPLVIADVATSLFVRDCVGPVILDNSSDPDAYALNASGFVGVHNSEGVWIRGLRMTTQFGLAMDILDSTVFMDDVRIEADPVQSFYADGPDGMEIRGTSLVVLSNSDIEGGTGGCSPDFLPPGTSGDALVLRDTSELFLLDTELTRGQSDTFPTCIQSAGTGKTLQQLGGSVLSTQTYSGVTPSSSFTVNSDFPVLTAEPVGRDVRFTLCTVPLSSGRVFFGGRTQLNSFAGAQIPLAFRTRFGRSLGFIQASGMGSTNIGLRGFQRGTVFTAQGSRTLLLGQTELSNPIINVVR
ncbi:MAG: hypothetical protein AAFR54_00625 [Planctomycetota bacterium]